MNLWLLGLVACFVGAWAPAVYTQGVFEDCCLAYHHHHRPSLKKHVQGYWIQDVSGSCNLPAVIFLFAKKNNSSSLRMMCANPQAWWVKDWVKFLHKKNDAHPKPCLDHQKAHSATCARLMSSKASNPSMNRTRTSLQITDSTGEAPTRPNFVVSLKVYMSHPRWLAIHTPDPTQGSPAKLQQEMKYQDSELKRLQDEAARDQRAFCMEPAAL